jgi:hypothetical protein
MMPSFIILHLCPCGRGVVLFCPKLPLRLDKPHLPRYNETINKKPENQQRAGSIFPPETFFENFRFCRHFGVLDCILK